MKEERVNKTYHNEHELGVCAEQLSRVRAFAFALLFLSSPTTMLEERQYLCSDVAKSFSTREILDGVSD